MPDQINQPGQDLVLDPEVLRRMPEYLQQRYAEPEEEVKDFETLARDFVNATADLAKADIANRKLTLEKDPFSAIQDPTKRFTMGERVMAAHAHERQRRQRGGEAYSTLSATEDWISKRAPIAGGLIHALETNHYTKIKGRIMDGSATPADIMSFADHVLTSQEKGDRAWYEEALDIASFMPGYVVEFTMSGGAWTIGKEVGKKAALRIVGNEMAERGMGRALLGTSGFVGGVGGRVLHPAHWGLTARNMADNMAPLLTIDNDDSNRLKMVIEREGDGFVEAFSKGLLLSYGELFGESIGGPISKGIGKITGKMPWVKDLKNVITRRWMGLGAGNTTDKLDEVLEMMGWNGVLMELGEEHVTDALAWSVGGMFGESRERGWERLGTTGLLFEGRIGEFVKKEATMAAGFSPFMVGQIVASYHNDQSALGNKLDQKLFEMSDAPDQAADRIEHLRGLVDYDKQDFDLFTDKAALDLFIQKDPTAAEEFLKKHVDAESPPTRKEFKNAGLPTYNISGEQRASFVKALNKYASTEMMGQHFEKNTIADNYLESDRSHTPLEKFVIRKRLEEYWAAHPEIDVNETNQALHPDVMDYALGDLGQREDYRTQYDKVDWDQEKVQSETRAQISSLHDQYNSMEEGAAKDLVKAMIENLQLQAKQELDAKDVNIEQQPPVPPVEEMAPEAMPPEAVPGAPVAAPEAPEGVPEAPAPAGAPRSQEATTMYESLVEGSTKAGILPIKATKVGAIPGEQLESWLREIQGTTREGGQRNIVRKRIANQAQAFSLPRYRASKVMERKRATRIPGTTILQERDDAGEVERTAEGVKRFSREQEEQWTRQHAGWKLHATISKDNWDEVKRILGERGYTEQDDALKLGVRVDYKLGTYDGKNLTFYSGSKRKSEEDANELLEALGHLTESPSDAVLKDDQQYVGNIYGRFHTPDRRADELSPSMREKRFHQYGFSPSGEHLAIPMTHEMTHRKAFGGPAITEEDYQEALRLLTEQFGTFFTGGAAAPAAPAPGVAGIQASIDKLTEWVNAPEKEFEQQKRLNSARKEMADLRKQLARAKAPAPEAPAPAAPAPAVPTAEEAPAVEVWGQYSPELRKSLEGRGYEMGESGLYEKRNKRGSLIYAHLPLPDATTSEEEKAKSRFMTLTSDDGKMLARSLIILRSENWEDAKRGAEALQLFMEMENNKKATERRLWDEYLLPAKGQKDQAGRSRNDKILYYVRSVESAKTIELRNVIAGLDETAQEMNIELKELEDLINSGYPIGIKLNSEVTVDYLKGEFEWEELPPPVQAWWGPKLEEEEPTFELEREKKKVGPEPERFVPEEQEQMWLFRGTKERPEQRDFIEEQEEEAPKKRFVPKEEKADTVIIDGKKHTKKMLETYSKEQLLELAAKAMPSQYVNYGKSKAYDEEYINVSGDRFISQILSSTEELETDEFLELIEQGLVARREEGFVSEKEKREAAKAVPTEPMLSWTPQFTPEQLKKHAEWDVREKRTEVIRVRWMEVKDDLINPEVRVEAVQDKAEKVTTKDLKDYARKRKIHGFSNEKRSGLVSLVANYVAIDEMKGRPELEAPAAQPVPAEPAPAAEGELTTKESLEEEFIGRDEESYWGIDFDGPEGSRFREFGCSGVMCTGFSNSIARRLPGRVKMYGFSKTDNPESYIANSVGGHDFAVVDGRFIVDPWHVIGFYGTRGRESGKKTDLRGSENQGVFDLNDPKDASIIEYLYGPRKNWVENKPWSKETIKDMGGLPPAPAAEEEEKAALPKMEENKIKPLSFYTDVAYREVDLAELDHWVGDSAGLLSTTQEVYFANTPNLALGQGIGGVLLEVNTEGLQGQVNRDKPSWGAAYELGNVELIGKYNHAGLYRDSVLSFTLKPDLKAAKHRKIRMKGFLRDLVAGKLDSWLGEWTVIDTPDGGKKYTRTPTPTPAAGKRVPKWWAGSTRSSPAVPVEADVATAIEEISLRISTWTEVDVGVEELSEVARGILERAELKTYPSGQAGTPRHFGRRGKPYYANADLRRWLSEIKEKASQEKPKKKEQVKEDPAAEPEPVAEEEKTMNERLHADVISGWSAHDLLWAKKNLVSLPGLSKEQQKSAIDSELERWAKKEEVDPGQVEKLEEEAGFDIDIGHYSETTNKADIEAYLMDNYEDVAALKRLAPELGAEFKSKTALASAIAEAQAKSVRANHILEHGTKNAPKVVTKKSDKSDFKMEGQPSAESPGRMNKTVGKNTEKDVEMEAILKGMKGAPTPEKIKNLIQHKFGVPIREGFARALSGTVLGIYKPVSKVIRMAKGGLLKLGTLMHELAHHLDNTLGITGEVGSKKRAAGLTKEMEDELKTLDYDVQAFVVALENAVESDVFRRKKIGMPKTRSELLGLVEQWNKKNGIFEEATVVNEIKNVSKKKIKSRMSEGFAEVIRIYMTDGMQMAARDDLPPTFDITNDFLQNEVYGAPKFMKWFLEDFLAQEGAPFEVARNLSQVRSSIKKWRKSTPEARVMAIFSTTWSKKRNIFTGDKKWQKEMKEFLTRSYVALVDKYHPLKAPSDQVKAVMKDIREDIDNLNKQFKESVSEAEKKELKKKIKAAEEGLSNRSTTYDWVMAHSHAAEGMTEDIIRNGPEAITKAPTKEGDVPGSRRTGPSLISAIDPLKGEQLEPWKGFVLSENTLEITLKGEEDAQRLKDIPGGEAIKRKTHEKRTEAISDQDASVVGAMVRGGFTQEGLETMVKIGLSPGQIINEILISKYKDRDGESLKIIGDISISALKTAMATKEWSSQNKQLVIDAINKMEKRESIRPEAELFIKSHDILTRYHYGLVQMLVDAELLTQERADRIKKRKKYVPMMRHMLDETGRFRKKIRKNKNVALQLYLPFGYLSKEGSTAEIIDPIESTIRLTTEVVNTAITQVALLNLGKDMIPEWGGIDGWEGTIREVDPNFGKNAVQLEGILTQLADMNVIEKEKADLFKAVWALRRYNAGEDTSFWHTRTKRGLPGLNVGKGEFLVFSPGRLKQLQIILESVDIEGSSAENLLENIREMFGEEGQAKEGIAAIDKQFKILEEMTESIPDAVTMFTTYFPKWEAASGEEGYYQAIIYKEGKPNLVEMHEEFYNSIHLLVNKYTAGPIQGLLRSIAKVVKTGSVRWNMMFAVKNVLRDLITNNFQAKHQSPVEGVTSPFYWLAVSFLHHAAKEKWPILKNFKGANLNELVDLYEKNGGNMNSWFFNSKEGVRAIQEMLERKHTADARNGGIFNSVKEFGNWYVDVIALSDVGPRLAEFYGVFKEHGYDINKQGQMVYVLDSDGKRQHISKGVLRTPPSDLIVLARNAAADVTTNFGRGGSLGKYFEQETVFLGAAIQGFDKQIRTIRDEYKRLKGAKDVGEFASEAVKSRLMWMSLVAMSYEIAYYMSRADDDDFKTQPWWERYTYWTFTDKNGKPIIKLPKGYGWSVVGNTTHAIWDSFYRNDPEAMTELFWHTLESDVPFSPQSLRNRFPPATLAWEYAANKSLFYDTPIERRNVVGRPKHLRYNDETDWLMRNLGWVTGKTINISPVQLEHGINSLTGGMYKQLSEKVGRVATTDFSLKGWTKTALGEFLPVVSAGQKAFTIKKDHTRDTNRFYDMREAASEKAEEEKLLEGGVNLETQMRRNTLELYAGLFSKIRKVTREIPPGDRDARFKYDKYVIGASRNALGLEPLDRYPNPFAEDLGDLPPEIREAVKDAKASQKWKANMPLPGAKYKRHKTWMETWKWWRATRDAARRWLLSQRESRM